MNTIKEMIAAVNQVSMLRYESSYGWQEIAECYTEKEMENIITELKCCTNQEAIDCFDKIAKMFTERQEEVEAEIF